MNSRTGMFGAAGVLAVFLAWPAGAPAQAQGLYGEYYENTGMTGTRAVAANQTMAYATIANPPAGTTPALSTDDNFGTRWTGVIVVPPAAGTGPVSVQFFLRTDDGGRLWVDGQHVIDQWRGQGVPGQPGPTGTINLIPGRRYSIVVHHYDSGGGAGAILEWIHPAQATQAQVPMTSLFQQVATPELSIASGAYTDAQVVSVRCGTPGATIEVDTGGGFAAYTGPFVVNANATISARASHPFLAAELVTSAVETITVTISDTNRPRVSMVQSYGQNQLRVVFSEPVVAPAAGNFTLAPAVGVSGASLQFDQRTVILTLAADLAEGTQYTLTTTGVQDRAAGANTILPGSQKVFVHRAWRTNGLVDWYKFDELSGLTANDASGSGIGGNNGTLPAQVVENRGPWFVEQGRFLGGLQFDGENDVVTTSNLNPVLGATTASLAVWVRTRSGGGYSNNFYEAIGITGLNGGAADDSTWGWISQNGRINFKVGDGTNIVAGGPVTNDFQWHHVVISRNGAAGNIRIDGDRGTTTSAAMDAGVKTAAFNLIGKVQGSDQRVFFPGLMDELRIYNAELTQADAISLANTIPAVTLSGPTAAVTINTPVNISALHGVDDAIPNGSAITYTWTSTPNTGVTFGSTTAQNTTVSFANPGQYLLRVVITDGHCSTSDDLTVDVSFISVTPVTGLITTEAGGTATFAVTIAQALLAGESVTIPISSSDIGEGRPTLDGMTTITQVVFAGPLPVGAQIIVTVVGVDDPVRDGDQPYQIVLGAATAVGAVAYNGADPADVDCTNLDDDVPAVNFSTLTNLATTESGGTASFTVVLQTAPQPGATVSIAFASTNPAEGVVTTGALLNFTDANWNVPQQVIVTGVDDAVIDLNQQYFAASTLTISAGADPDYALINPPDPFLVNIDNEAVPDADDAWGCGTLGAEILLLFGLAALRRRRRS
jgi:hypothetical protein